MGNFTFINKITITQRRATTAFDRKNYTILEVIKLSDDWQPTNYGPEDLFPLFDTIYRINISAPGWDTSTQYLFLISTWEYFTSRIQLTQLTGADEGFVKLRSLFATLVLRFNNVVWSGPLPDNMGKSISLAKSSYRVISPRPEDEDIGGYQSILGLDICSLCSLNVGLVPWYAHRLQVRSDSNIIPVSRS
jgi:hypothetical protein